MPNNTIQNCVFLFRPFDIDATHAGDVASMPFSIGGLGLKKTNESCCRFPGEFGPMLFPMVKQRYLEVADEIYIA